MVKYMQEWVKKNDPTIHIPDTPIVGIIVLQFPADHDESHKIYSTALGKVCLKCAVDCIVDMTDKLVQEENKLAT